MFTSFQSRLPSIHSLRILLFLSLFLFSSCSFKSGSDLPGLPIGNEGYRSGGKFIWFELLSEDTEKAIQFYSKLFHWRIRPSSVGRNYHFIENNDALIGGMIPLSGKDSLANESRWISTLSVENVQEAIARLTAVNGAVLSGPEVSGKRGELALVRDSLGAELVLLRTGNGDPPQYELTAGNPVWIDLFTSDYKTSTSFYNSLAGFSTVTQDDEKGHYYFMYGNRIRAGMVSIAWEDVTQNWLPYIGVRNLRESVQKAISLGATLVASTEQAAVIVDPTGAAIGMQLLPEGGTK